MTLKFHMGRRRSEVILIGSPRHIGGSTRSARKFIDKIGKLDKR